MSDVDEMTSRKLRSLAASYHVDTETDLQAVLARQMHKERSRRWARPVIAAAVALTLAIPVMLAGFVLGRANGGRLQVQDPGSRLSPEQSIPSTWGGTLVWGVGQRSVSAETDGASYPLPAGLHGGIVSPDGPEGGVYTFHGEVPPGDFPTIWYPDGRTVDVALTVSEPFDLTLPSWSPDGASLAAELCVGGPDRDPQCSVILISPADGSTSELASSNSQGVSWSPDGTQIAFVGADRQLTVVDVKTGEIRSVLPLADFDDLLRPAWAPSGKLIGLVAHDDDGYLPLIVSLDGVIVGTGMSSAGSPPRIMWRRGMDSLVVGQESYDGGTVATSVAEMSGPTWTPTALIRLEGQSRPELWSSPEGEALLLQTLDQGILNTTAGSDGNPYTWTVIEVDSGVVEQWTLTDVQVLDWR